MITSDPTFIEAIDEEISYDETTADEITALYGLTAGEAEPTQSGEDQAVAAPEEARAIPGIPAVPGVPQQIISTIFLIADP